MIFRAFLILLTYLSMPILAFADDLSEAMSLGEVRVVKGEELRQLLSGSSMIFLSDNTELKFSEDGKITQSGPKGNFNGTWKVCKKGKKFCYRFKQEFPRAHRFDLFHITTSKRYFLYGGGDGEVRIVK